MAEVVRPIRSLRTRESFDALSQSGRRVRGRWCWARIASHPDGDVEVGYAIGRHVGNAVVRNRIRRRLKAVIAHGGDQLAPGRYLIGVNNDKVASMNFTHLQADLMSLVAVDPDAAADKASDHE